MFLDSHCHLTYPELAVQFDAVLARAHTNQVTAFINIGDNIEASLAAREQTTRARTKGVRMWSTAGVHPQHANAYTYSQTDSTTQQLYDLGAGGSICAIGEIGLDFVYDETHPHYPGATRAVQERVFREQLEIAGATGLPVVIHNRDADDRILGILTEHAPRLHSGVLHCFGSPLEVAHRALDLGFYLGFGGLVTFKNAESVREVAKFCPLEAMLLETDSPYLAPVPFRGKTNEPSYLPRVAEVIAMLHGKSVEEIGAITTQNAVKLFALEEQGSTT